MVKGTPSVNRFARVAASLYTREATVNYTLKR